MESMKSPNRSTRAIFPNFTTYEIHWRGSCLELFVLGFNSINGTETKDSSKELLFVFPHTVENQSKFSTFK